ncbi:recombinase family protein, partial [Nocardia niwae]|uniref:recombinase family protein n=1 Tax=Nocardia niwae TaxID=626084 RepID=UPI001FE19A62
MGGTGREGPGGGAIATNAAPDLIVLEQGIDTTTPAGRFLFHVIVAMDEMTADLISEGTLEGLNPAPTSALEP